MVEYGFIAKLFNIEIPTSNKGKQIHNQLRISNGRRVIEQYFLNEAFTHNIGKLEMDALLTGSYVYAIGETNELTNFGTLTKADENERFNFLNHFMTITQLFNNAAWLVKDNGINTELGFLVLKQNKYDCVTSNMRTVSFTMADGQNHSVSFSNQELEEAIDLLHVMNIHWLDDYKTKEVDSLEEFNQSRRISRSTFFLQSARSQSHLPIKITLYCSVLETLLSTDTTEITFKIAIRTAKLLSDDVEERKAIFSIVKEAYSIRSRTIHGDSLSKTKKSDMVRISIEIDRILRKLFNKIYTSQEIADIITSKDTSIINRWLDELTLM